ncbi:MAG: hypothetical protein MHPSP_000693 [Paramarteilia canceri]
MRDELSKQLLETCPNLYNNLQTNVGTKFVNKGKQYFYNSDANLDPKQPKMVSELPKPEIKCWFCLDNPHVAKHLICFYSDKLVEKNRAYFEIVLEDTRFICTRMKKFSTNFVREILCSKEMLDMEERTDWRLCVNSVKEEEELSKTINKELLEIL